MMTGGLVVSACMHSFCGTSYSVRQVISATLAADPLKMTGPSEVLNTSSPAMVASALDPTPLPRLTLFPSASSELLWAAATASSLA